MDFLVAEASPCCPSPLVGNVLVAMYIAAGIFAYAWLAFTVNKWVRSRRAQRGTSTADG